jgi:glutaredoxin
VAVKLHRCSLTWVKIGGHPCWRVQKALDQAGVDYEVVKEPPNPRKRQGVEELSGQSKYPVIEFENGRIYRAESKEMAAKIRAGELFSGDSPPPTPPAA